MNKELIEKFSMKGILLKDWKVVFNKPQSIEKRIIVLLSYILTYMQLADILSKAIHRPNIEDITTKLGMGKINIYEPT